MLVLGTTVSLFSGAGGAVPGLQIDGLTPVTYTEGGDPVPVAPGITISGGGTFADGYIEFAVDGATAEDRLFLPTGTTPDTTEGAITVIGDAVHLGLGGGAHKQIGTVGTPNDGQQGRPLRVDFSAALPNAKFADGVDGNGHPTGWTVNERQVTMGSLASKTQQRPVTVSGSGPYTISGPGYSFQSDWNYSPSGKPGWAYEGGERALDAGSFDSAVTSHAGSAQALRLYSVSGDCPGPNAATYCSAFGPDAWSSTFEAKAGDDLAFDWSAANGDDDYEVYGFLVDADTGTHTELMYGRGRAQGWTTSTGTIPADGTYQFRFVSGTYDATGGLVVGASLYIDDVRVLSSDATDAVAQAVARLVHYEHTGQNPPDELTVGVTATDSNGTAGPEEVTAEVTLVDDPPVAAALADVVYTNTAGVDSFDPEAGSVVATDPEGDPISYRIVGGTADPRNIGGRSYTHSLAGDLATLHLDETDGAYVVVPHASTLDAALTASAEAFTVAAVANGLEATQSLTVRIAIAPSAPGPVSDVVATLGDGSVTLNWTAPTWLGGSPVDDHVIEISTDGGATWTTAVASTGSGDSSHVVTGLTPGEDVLFRVVAVNASGAADPSTPLAVTPATVPGAPTITSIVPGNHVLTVHLAAPADDGGAPVETYEYSIDGGLTWTSRSTLGTTSPLRISPVDNGTTHPVRVRAVNAAGPGAPSNEVPVAAVAAPVLPSTPDRPPAPTGSGVLLVDGAERPVTMSAPSPLTGEIGTPAGTLRFGDGSFVVDLLGLDPSGEPLELDAHGRLIIVAGAFAEVSGEGFRPGSTVDVWLMSTPVHLGDVVVGADGSFSQRLPIPEGIAPGPHTVQLNGIAADGSVRTLSVGVVVRDPVDHGDGAGAAPSGGSRSGGGAAPAALAFTGLHAAGVSLLGLVMLLAGAALTGGGRRARTPRRGGPDC